MYYWPDWPWPASQPFKLLGDKVLLRVAAPPSMSPGGIALVRDMDAHWAIPDRGEVLQFGLKVSEGLKKEIAIGDMVAYHKQRGTDFQRGKEHLLLIESEFVLLRLGTAREGSKW